MPKGEKVLAQSKRTAPPPIFKNLKSLEMMNFSISILFSQLVSYYIQKGEKVAPSKSLKPSWTLRGGFHQGGVLFSQKKSIWYRGRKFQILKMLLKIILIYLWLFAKVLWKQFTKVFAKTKTCGASVVQNIKNKETIHAYPMKIFISSILSNLCTYNYAN
jgi:hypothetical protein